MILTFIQICNNLQYTICSKPTEFTFGWFLGPGTTFLGIFLHTEYYSNLATLEEIFTIHFVENNYITFNVCGFFGEAINIVVFSYLSNY